MSLPEPLVLFDNPLSPFARKVRIALREKGAPFEVRPIETKADRGELLRVNPRGEVPTLVVGDRAVAGSELICELVDEAFPEPPLLPREPLARAAARGLERFCDEHLDALQFLASLADRVGPQAGSEAELARHLADLRERCFDVLAGALGERT